MIEKYARTKDNYRPLFCEATFYQDHISDFVLINRSIQHLNFKEQIVIWIISCSCLRRPKNWFSGRQSLPSISFNAGPFSIYDLFTQLKVSWPSSLPQDISLYEFCRTVRITPLPLAALKALYYFYTEKYPLEILNYEPNPLELLKLQIKGRRVLTFKKDYTVWPDLKYGQRDVPVLKIL